MLLLAFFDAQVFAEDSIDFLHKVQPILAEHCFQCHGPDEAVREADLRLDVREVATAQLPSEFIAIVPGAADESELIQRITTADSDLLMPPAHFEKPLSPAQIATLRNWIDQGAPYSQHWAFQQPERAATVDGTTTNPIDQIVTRRLQSEGLTQSPTAPIEILCRRIHLDLVGLPPSPQDIDTFLHAASTDLAAAIDAEIQRLLASAHYGEKWARHWLDVARYSDSNGYEKDVPREQWAWRDWVIQAINEDLPYDQFIVEQIAGDLLPGATQDQIVATGFLRNSMINEEGAIIPEEFRMEAMFDRMDCVGKAVLGLTVQCAQCHSHKYDPISHDEYYGMMAFLNNANDAQMHVFRDEQLQSIEKIRKALFKIRQRYKQDRPHWQAELEAWEKKTQLADSAHWEILDPIEATWGGGSNHPEKLPDHSISVLGHPSHMGDMYVIADCDLNGVTGFRLEALTYGDLPFGGPGRSIDSGIFALSELTVQVKVPGATEWTQLPLQKATADYSSPDNLFSSLPLAQLPEEDQRRIGPVGYLIDGNTGTAWVSDRGPGRRNTPSVAVIQFGKPLEFPSKTQIRIYFQQHHARSNDTENPQNGMLILGRFRVALTKSPDPVAPPYDHAVSLAWELPAEARSAAQQAAIEDTWLQAVVGDEYKQELENIWKQYPDSPVTSVLCFKQREDVIARQTQLLDRGVWNQPLHSVQPQVLSALHPLEASQEPGRLQFARWLADRRSPLTARVQVNRIWQAIFGTGLVETAEDFGSRARQPEHLELLDHLAVEFMEHRWSQKWLLNQILTSKIYQQSSDTSLELLEKDPRNRFLARGPRFRAEAEVLRDMTLATAGLLSREIGGPSFFPPVPESVLSFNFTFPKYWEPAKAPQRYRRSLYLFRKRTMPDPVMATFDAPSGDTACARRTRSNSPLAALVSLNEPVFVEAAQALALRVLREAEADEHARADYLFRLCTSRSAKPEERKEIVNLVTAQRPRLADGWISISDITTGDQAGLPSLPPNTSPQDLAAWVIAARVVLNLDAALCKN